jgi:hypothetical protein
MKELPELIAAIEECAARLHSSARRLRKHTNEPASHAAADLGEVDHSLLELHHRIGHLLGAAAASAAATPPAKGEIAVDELTALLYRTINPPESRRNYTYTPPFSIEKVLRAYLDWITGPGKGVNIRS